MTHNAFESGMSLPFPNPGGEGGGTSYKKATGDVLLDGVAFSQLD